MALPLLKAEHLLMCDFDGTLFDGMNPKAEALHQTFSEFFPSLARRKNAIMKSFFDHGGRSTEDIIQGTAERMNVNLDDAVLQKMRGRQLELERKFVEEKGRFFEDSRNLKELENHGIAVGITTSGDQPLVHGLVHREGYQDVFSFIGGRGFEWEEKTGGQFRKGKSHLELINAYRQRHGLPPLSISYWGDTVKDLEEAVALGAEKIFMRQGTMSRKDILAAAERMGLRTKVVVVKLAREVVEHLRNRAS